jgi:SAM-dependent methyltransferase
MYKQYTLIEANNPHFWSDHWDKQDINRQMLVAKKSELIPIFKKYLPENGKILEAGCGQGIFVNALNELGYDVEGIDFDEKTVKKVISLFPKLRIKKGDVFNLDYPDNSLNGYISLGVIEHYEKDWRIPLKEAGRALGNNGILFLAVPYFNYVKQLISPERCFLKKPSGKFYQYLFKQKEITEAVKAGKFHIVGIDFYGKSKTLMSLPFFGRMLQKQYQKIKSDLNETESTSRNVSKFKNSVKQFIFRLLPKKWFAHMIVIIAKK